MDNNTNRNQGTLVNVKRVRKDTDNAGRDKLVLTFGTDKEGQNGLDALIAALETYRGKQVNFDIRVGEKVAKNGSKFDTAFVIVKEMIPKEGGAPVFTPKPSRAAQTKATAAQIREDFKG